MIRKIWAARSPILVLSMHTGRHHCIIKVQLHAWQYRSLLGLPGGINSPLFSVIQSAAAQSPMKLFKGEGNEPDTLGAKAVLVMDSDKFPFFPAEASPAKLFAGSHVEGRPGVAETFPCSGAYTCSTSSSGLPPVPQ